MGWPTGARAAGGSLIWARPTDDDDDNEEKFALFLVLLNRCLNTFSIILAVKSFENMCDKCESRNPEEIR